MLEARSRRRRCTCFHRPARRQRELTEPQRLETSAARRESASYNDIGSSSGFLHRHAAGFFDELDKLPDSSAS